jgi:hypothetical protein
MNSYLGCQAKNILIFLYLMLEWIDYLNTYNL